MLFSDGQLVINDRQPESKMCKTCFATNEGYRYYCKNCGERL